MSDGLAGLLQRVREQRVQCKEDKQTQTETDSTQREAGPEPALLDRIKSLESQVTELTNKFQVLEKGSRAEGQKVRYRNAKDANTSLTASEKPTASENSGGFGKVEEDENISNPKASTDSCKICRGKHKVENCVRFKGLNPRKRHAAVKQFKLCWHCLSGNHAIKDCLDKDDKLCGVGGCVRFHHPLLHPEESVNFENVEKTDSCYREPKLSQNHCPLCKGNHCLEKCDEFLGNESKTRQGIVKKFGCCLHCLQGIHKVKKCRNNKDKQCGVEGCNRYHHALLHPTNAVNLIDL